MAELGTIESIKSLRDEIRLKIKNLSSYSKDSYGKENEYSHKGKRIIFDNNLPF